MTETRSETFSKKNNIKLSDLIITNTLKIFSASNGNRSKVTTCLLEKFN